MIILSKKNVLLLIIVFLHKKKMWGSNMAKNRST